MEEKTSIICIIKLETIVSNFLLKHYLFLSRLDYFSNAL